MIALPHLIKTTLTILMLLVWIGGCGSSSSDATSDESVAVTTPTAATTDTNSTTTDTTTDSSSDTDTDTDDSSGTDETNSATDIKDAAFTDRSPICTSYVGTYTATVTDVARSMEFVSETTITEGNATCIIATHEIPNHDFNDTGGFVNDTSAQNGQFTITQFPQAASAVTAIDLSTTNAIMLNGVTIDLLAAACYDTGNETLGQEKIGCNGNGTNANHPWRYDPMSSLNRFGTDTHNAHTQPDGTYHYHGDPRAMYDLDCVTNQTVSPVIGFAADGFPVYGPCIQDGDGVRVVTSSYQLKAGARQDVSGYTTPEAGVGVIASTDYDGQFIGDWEYRDNSGDLDQCNGMMVDGNYGYYLTSTYPWVLACYTGTVNDSFNKMGAKLSISLHGHQHIH